jgi:L-alanine-DL-glutamate epimerase-like enolase superfamily enzyme
MNATPPVRLTLDKVVVRVIQVPLRRPIVAKLGEFKNFPFILTDVHTKEGVIGHSYLEPYRVTATKSIVALIEDMAGQQRGKRVAPFDRFEEAMRSLHLLGRQGVMLIATAALDMAMWDALAKAMGCRWWSRWAARWARSAPTIRTGFGSFPSSASRTKPARWSLKQTSKL